MFGECTPLSNLMKQLSAVVTMLSLSSSTCPGLPKPLLKTLITPVSLIDSSRSARSDKTVIIFRHGILGSVDRRSGESAHG